MIYRVVLGSNILFAFIWIIFHCNWIVHDFNMRISEFSDHLIHIMPNGLHFFFIPVVIQVVLLSLAIHSLFMKTSTHQNYLQYFNFIVLIFSIANYCSYQFYSTTFIAMDMEIFEHFNNDVFPGASFYAKTIYLVVAAVLFLFIQQVLKYKESGKENKHLFRYGKYALLGVSGIIAGFFICMTTLDKTYVATKSHIKVYEPKNIDEAKLIHSIREDLANEFDSAYPYTYDIADFDSYKNNIVYDSAYYDVYERSKHAGTFYLLAFEASRDSISLRFHERCDHVGGYFALSTLKIHTMTLCLYRDIIKVLRRSNEADRKYFENYEGLWQ